MDKVNQLNQWGLKKQKRETACRRFKKFERRARIPQQRKPPWEKEVKGRRSTSWRRDSLTELHVGGEVKLKDGDGDAVINSDE